LEAGEGVVTMGLMPEDLRDELLRRASTREAPPPNVDLRQMTQARIHETLAAMNGNVSKAASQLGISRSTLYRKLAQRIA